MKSRCVSNLASGLYYRWRSGAIRAPFVKRLELFTLAQSLGVGGEPCVHSGPDDHAAMTPEARAGAGISDTLGQCYR